MRDLYDMTWFFLDTEYTNGNYYQGDIFEIALVSENTYRIFHQYVKIPCSVPNNIKWLCNISDKVLQQKGVSFTHMIKRLMRFVKSENKNTLDYSSRGLCIWFPITFYQLHETQFKIPSCISQLYIHRFFKSFRKCMG